METTTRSVQCELTQSMAKRLERPQTDRPESLFKSNTLAAVAAKRS